MSRTLYTIHWSRLLPQDEKVATPLEKAKAWNTRRGLYASEVARLLETEIVPKMYQFEIRYRVNGGDTAPFITGDADSIKIRRDFKVSPTILKALA